MSSSNNYGVEISMNFTSFEKVNKDYQSILKRLSSEGKINVGVGINLDQFNRIKESFKEVVNQKVMFDTTGAKTEIKTLKNSANELITVVKKFNNVGEELSTSYSSSSSAKLESQIGIYKELNKLQTTEFNLKKQMTSAEGVHYEELNKQLQTTRQLQQYTGKMLSSNDLVSEKLNNELLQKRLELKNKLNVKNSKIDEKGNQSQLQAEIKVSEQYEARLKEIEAIKLRLAQKTNLSLSDGQLNNSTYNNLKNQISKIDVNTSKESIDRITQSVDNLGKSSDRVLKLTNEINKYKKSVENIKTNSSDSLGVGGNIDKLNKFNTSLENSNSILNKLKKNSQSVSNTKFNESMVNLGSSFGDLKTGVDLAEKQKKYIQEGVDLYNKSEKDKTKKLQEEINTRIKLEQNYSDLWNKLLNTKSRSDKTQATSELQSAGGLLGNLKDSGVYSENYIKKLQTQFNSLNLNTPIEKIKEFKNQLQLLGGGNENGIVKLSRNIDGFENKLATLKSKYKGLVPDAELNKFENLLNKLKIKLDSMKNNGDIINDNKLKSEIDNVTKSYEKLNLVTKENGFKTGNQDVRSFGEALVNTASKMGVYLSSAIAFQKIFQEFKEAVSYVETMDKSITDMKMITGQSTEQVSSMVDEFKKLGAEMHTSNTEVIAGGAELLRAGYNAEESSAMMKASILGSKVSGQTTPTVTEQLIAMKNAFNLSADSMEHYVDIMSKLDNSSATSFKEIAEAVQRTAFSAQQAGTPLETLMTYITTVSEKTRKSAETIGESFKTIYSRYSNIKLGNLDEDGKSINDTEKAMARVGIQIRDSKDSFREFDDVLQEFMAKNKSGQISQVDYLAGVQALAGTRKQKASYVQKCA